MTQDISTTTPETLLGGGGAKMVPHYQDQHENFMLVSKATLRELSTLGWLQEGQGAAGMFFLSGSVWLRITLYAEHSNEPEKFVPWFLFCAACVVFGGLLIWASYKMFSLKQKKIEDAFEGAKSNEQHS